MKRPGFRRAFLFRTWRSRYLPRSVLGDHRAGAAAEAVGDCLLYTSDAADERSSVDLGGRRIITKKKQEKKQKKKTHYNKR